MLSTALCKARLSNVGQLTTKILMIMKIMVILFTAFCLQISAKGLGQQIITLDLKDASLIQLFSEIRKQTGYDFIYKDEVLKNSQKVNIKVKNRPLDQVLDLCFRSQPLIYTISGNIITVKNKKLNPANNINDQALLPINVKGRVINEKGEPIIRASVQVKSDKSKGTFTDENGYFELKGIDDNSILIVSAVNIETLEWDLNGKTDFVISTKAKITEQEEMRVISTGYQEIPKERATGSFIKVTNSLYNRKVSTDILSRLDGIVPSLLFDKRLPSPKMNLRGISSIRLDNSPLIVLDNFPYEGDVSNINPNDIETISILRDAAAASIWGAKAGNGVIVLTTKKGKYNEPFRVSLTSNVSFTEKPNIFYDQQYMSSSSFIDVETFLFSKGFYNSNFTNNSRPVISPVVEILNKRKLGQISPADSMAQIQALRNFDVRNYIGTYINRPSTKFQNSVQIAGGSSNVNYLFSFGYDYNLDDKIGNKYDRYTGKLTASIRPSTNFELRTNVTYSEGEDYIKNSVSLSPGGGKTAIYPYARLADLSGNALPVTRDYRDLYTDTAGNGKLLDWKFRPLDEIKFGNDRRKLMTLFVNVDLRYNLTRELKFELNNFYEKQNNENKNYKSLQTYFTRNLINRFTQINGSTVTRIIPLGGIMDQLSGTLTNYGSRLQANYEREWSNRLELSSLAGSEIREINNTSQGNTVYGYDDEILTYANMDFITRYPIYGNLSSSSSIPSNILFSNTTNRFLSMYANFALTYDKRYTVSGSARKDASNLFGVKTNQKWQPLWSVGSNWNIDNEKFYHFKLLQELKLRATFGYRGNIGNNSALPTISYANNPDPYTNSLYANSANPPNPQLRWERIRTFNLGLDFATLKNRIAGTIEYYSKTATDLLSPSPIDPTTGFSTVIRNIGVIKGSGFDIQINSKNIDKTFKWETNLSLSYSRDVISKYYGPLGTVGTYVTAAGLQISPIEGKYLYPVFSYQWAGLDPATGDPRGILNKSVSTNYSSLVNDSIQNLIYHGSALPLHYGFLINTISWKSFSVSFNITYKFDYYFRRTGLSYTALFNSWIGHSDYEMRWQKTGDENSTTVPSLIYPANANRDAFYLGSPTLVEKGDHIRLNDVTVNYTWKNRENKKIPVKAIRLFVFGNNLGIIWRANKHGVDPDYKILPPRKTFSVGFKADF